MSERHPCHGNCPIARVADSLGAGELAMLAAPDADAALQPAGSDAARARS